MRWRFLWRNPSVWCLELCNVYPARCRQPGVGAGTTDQWERWPGPPCRGRGCHRAQPRHSPVDGGSLPSHRGLDETTFLDNCTVLYCTVLYCTGRCVLCTCTYWHCTMVGRRLEAVGGRWGRWGRAGKENNHQDARNRNLLRLHNDYQGLVISFTGRFWFSLIMHASFTKTLGCSISQ